MIIKNIDNEVIYEDNSDTIKETVENAVRDGISLKKADLQDANLIGADLEYANLEYANLVGANLVGAMLEYANLEGVNLRNACIKYANLQGANLDFSCLPLWCGSIDMKVDERIAKQLAAHTFNLIKDFWPGELSTEQINWLNDFHRIKSNEFPKFK